MEQSVKKRNAHNIYFGLDQATERTRHISEVVSGAKCGCICSACGKPLEARKGSVRKHHFAHISNYECMYASEVAIYKAVADILGDSRCIFLPPITLSFPAWDHEDQLKKARKVELENISFSCEPLQYPPVLFVIVFRKTLRVLLEFENYYSQEDLCIFANEAREGNYSSLLCHFPSIDNEGFFLPEHLKEVLISGVKEQKWIRSALADQWRNRFFSKAIRPTEWGSGYECPIHVGKYRGKYSARWTDCAYCRFNLAEPPDCLCLAVSGIQCHKDFSEEPAALQKRIDEFRQQNDREIEQQEKRKAQVKKQWGQQHPTKLPPAIPVARLKPPPEPTQNELFAEEQRIKNSFNSQAETETRDQYGRRWIQCEHCGQIKEVYEFSDYGGVGRTNRGLCKICSREII